MADFKSIDAALAYIQKAVTDGLHKEVFEYVKDVEEIHILNDVYSVYTPKMYERRGEAGLGNAGNIKDEDPNSENTLSVINVTEPDPFGDHSTTDKNLAEVIEYGVGYDYDYPYAYNQPRPFTQNTIDDLEQSQIHVVAMKNALKRQGLNVK